jgi:hypothetical protein
MEWVDTRWLSAQMVEFFACGDIAHPEAIGHSMCVLLSVTLVEPEKLSVAVGFLTARPEPAAILEVNPSQEGSRGFSH